MWRKNLKTTEHKIYLQIHYKKCTKSIKKIKTLTNNNNNNNNKVG